MNVTKLKNTYTLHMYEHDEAETNIHDRKVKSHALPGEKINAYEIKTQAYEKMDTSTNAFAGD